MNYRLMNANNLAFIGDAYLALVIKEYLINSGDCKVNDLQKKSTKFLSATSQARIVNILISESKLSEEEILIVKRGRNSKTKSVAKNAKIIDYKLSTGFEALIGCLYLEKQNDRLDEIIKETIRIGES